MEYINRQLLNELMETDTGGLAVTIYAPMHVTSSPPHISENQLRFKNLISQAIDRLGQDDAGKRLAGQLRETRDRLYDDLEFWKHQTKGFLLCATPGTVRMFHLPVDTEEYVAIDDNFHLAWVLGVINDEQEYYVLTLAQHNPKLLRGDMFGLHPTSLELPETIRQALNIDEANQKSENQGSATGSSMNTGWFNGRGGARNPQEEDRIRFFRLIDSFVTEHIEGSAPLILAGIESETVEYRNNSRYPQLLDSIIPGNHTGTPQHDLFEKAYQIVRSDIIEPAHQAAIEDYQNTQGAMPDKAAADSKSIHEAAKQGRVDKLLLRMTRETSDTIRDTIHAVSRITFPEPEARKHFNDLAAQVWRMSGSVIGLPASQMPSGATMVAKFRY